MRPSPGLVLAALLVLVVAQVTRLVAPERGRYWSALALAAAGLAAAEVVAATGHLAGPTLGALHPLLDLPVMAVAEAGGVFLRAPASPGSR